MESAWRKLNNEVSNCCRCRAIVETRSKQVRGIGSPRAKIIIVGLAPGKDGADLTGIPFTRDPSGELINEMLSAAGLSRDQDVFITNLVKCNPKDAKGRNRTPSKEEIKNCFPYLRCEIDYLKPRIIIPLGKAATEFLLNIKINKMTEVHGKSKVKNGILFFPFIHPSYVIRGAYDKKKYLNEFKVLGDAFQGLIQQESRLSRLDILLLLLKRGSDDISEGFIRGKTRLQKLLFLMQDELKNRGYKAKFAFRPYLYGPYSRELYTDIEWLRMNKLIEVKTDFSEEVGIVTDFIITEEGKQRLIVAMDSEISKNIDEIAKGVIEKYSQMSVTQLVEFVHKKFSDYDKSQLKRKEKHINMKLDSFIYKGLKGLNDKSKSLKKEI